MSNVRAEVEITGVHGRVEVKGPSGGATMVVCEEGDVGEPLRQGGQHVLWILTLASSSVLSVHTMTM